MLKKITTNLVQFGKQLVPKLMLRDAGSIILISIIVVCAIAGVTSKIWLGHDNPVEEAAEKSLKMKQE